MFSKDQVQFTSITEEAIAERAYLIWQANGCPAGDGQEDWENAKAQLLAEAAGRQAGPLRRLFSRLRDRAAMA
ncbi:MAG: DUF2934 domain-containing protein [Planctomycetales bacterium]|nr:DUF2934 domain-containing protein [Planctomycetales bacterium]